TEGLLYSGGVLYESIGLYGRSQLRREDLATGRVLASVALAPDRFGEGLALLGGRLYQLTWKSHSGYVYASATLARVDSFAFPGEGWGMTTNGTALIMSDGSDSLRFFDPHTFATVRELHVRSGGLPLKALNELEYVHGGIYANVYQSNWIVRVDPTSGNVTQWLDLSALVPAHDPDPANDVLNGIAFDAATGDLLVTGKKWPVLFDIHPDSAENTR
ncbi:MAG: glutaminyl-peptide cyclotransferase, partial [Gemmatimonadaceae bacterium]